jgi:hypothetical protein
MARQFSPGASKTAPERTVGQNPVRRRCNRAQPANCPQRGATAAEGAALAAQQAGQAVAAGQAVQAAIPAHQADEPKRCSLSAACAALMARSRSCSVASPSASRSATSTAVRLRSSVRRPQILRQQAQANNRRLRSLTSPHRKTSISCGSSHANHSCSSTPSPPPHPADDTTPDAA